MGAEKSQFARKSSLKKSDSRFRKKEGERDGGRDGGRDEGNVGTQEASPRTKCRTRRGTPYDYDVWMRETPKALDTPCNWKKGFSGRRGSGYDGSQYDGSQYDGSQYGSQYGGSQYDDGSGADSFFAGGGGGGLFSSPNSYEPISYLGFNDRYSGGVLKGARSDQRHCPDCPDACSFQSLLCGLRNPFSRKLFSRGSSSSRGRTLSPRQQPLEQREHRSPLRSRRQLGQLGQLGLQTQIGVNVSPPLSLPVSEEVEQGVGQGVEQRGGQGVGQQRNVVETERNVHQRNVHQIQNRRPYTTESSLMLEQEQESSSESLNIMARLMQSCSSYFSSSQNLEVVRPNSGAFSPGSFGTFSPGPLLSGEFKPQHPTTGSPNMLVLSGDAPGDPHSHGVDIPGDSPILYQKSPSEDKDTNPKDTKQKKDTNRQDTNRQDINRQDTQIEKRFSPEDTLQQNVSGVSGVSGVSAASRGTNASSPSSFPSHPSHKNSSPRASRFPSATSLPRSSRSKNDSCLEQSCLEQSQVPGSSSMSPSDLNGDLNETTTSPSDLNGDLNSPNFRLSCNDNDLHTIGEDTEEDEGGRFKAL